MQSRLCIACNCVVTLLFLAWAGRTEAEPAGCDAAEYRMFDFWVGDWEVRLADGRVRQYFEESREPGVWQPWFEGFYSRPEASD